jgi:hypothetical protein
MIFLWQNFIQIHQLAVETDRLEFPEGEIVLRTALTNLNNLISLIVKVVQLPLRFTTTEFILNRLLLLIIILFKDDVSVT